MHSTPPVQAEKPEQVALGRSDVPSITSWAAGRSGGYPTWQEARIDHDASRGLGAPIGLGLRFRSPTPGPEHELVEAFLSSLKSTSRRGRRLTVFSEPALESGYPDIVAVEWRPGRARKWAPERQALTSDDLKLLHALCGRGWTEISFLEKVFRRPLAKRLGFLAELSLVVLGSRKCRLRSLNEVFAVERIIAIEAKVASWRSAIRQASANAWYSSESLVLIPSAANRVALGQTARKFNVGVVLFESDSLSELCEAPRRPVPLSYGSWLFNEWVWRIALRTRDLSPGD